MTTPKFTPGPWAAEIDSDTSYIGPWSGRRSDRIDGDLPLVDRVLFRIDSKDGATLADIYLAAAAPDLYAALVDTLDCLEPATFDPGLSNIPPTHALAIQKARAALAKARSE